MVQNEINNLGFLTGEAKSKMSKVNAPVFKMDIYLPYKHQSQNHEPKNLKSCSFTVRWGPGEETQAAPRRVLLHPDLSDHRCPEEDAAHRPQHVHARRPGAHFLSQETLQSCKLSKKKDQKKHALQQSSRLSSW